ncbi:MAG: 4Fe-4S binding protein [Verrucomicrobia bacterium]|nr:4Fe-4S binding protein [Verrucomicrobiota bacterium]
MKTIVCRIDRCLACRSCELACVVAHSKSGNLADAMREPERPAPRVRVRAADKKGDGVRPRSKAVQCRQCANAACIEACGVSGAIRRDEVTGVIMIDPEQCTGCWACELACPHGAILRSKDGRYAIVCDRCGDRDVPACVEACLAEALVLKGTDSKGPSGRKQ